MIISKIYNRINKIKNSDLREGLLWGLLGDLFGGLLWGLSLGLLGGLLWGLSLGLLGGLLLGLRWGLLWGLAFISGNIISVGIISLFKYYPDFIPVYILIVLGVIFLEIFYWLDNDKIKKKENKYLKVVLKKLEAGAEVIILFGFLNLIRLGIENLNKVPHEIIIKWSGYIGIGIVGLLIIIVIGWLYVKLNSLKYSDSRTRK